MSGKSKRNSIRIIGGDWRGRRLPVAGLDGLRPTGDRVRETLFNWLQPTIIGARVLDMFAGTGALAFESLSRGAASAMLIEQSREAATTLRENAALLGASADIVATDSRRLVARGCKSAPFNLAFVDPPFVDDDAVDQAMLLAEHGWLSPGALVYVEQPLGQARLDAPAFEVVREKTAGRVQFGLYRLAVVKGST